LIIGCIYSWALTLVTACGLVLIVAWYSVITPLIVKKHGAVQQVEREASDVVGQSLLGVRMVAACGAEEKMALKYNTLVERARTMSEKMSPVLAVQHAPGRFGRKLSLTRH
jgi:ATP-binding cassette subfamily B (MDR/TAP) protein 1